MNNRGHRYVKPAHRTGGPVQVIVAVPTVTTFAGHKAGRTRMVRGDACHVAYTRRRGPNWSTPELADGLTAPELWDFVDGRLYDRSRLWIVAPSAGDLLTLMGFWDRCEDGRYQVVQDADARGERTDKRTGKLKPWFGRLVLRGRPDIVSARKDRCGLTAVSLSNYTSADLGQLAEWVGVPTGGPDSYLYRVGLSHFSSIDARNIVLKTFQRLVSEWVVGDCGPWRETVGQLVISLWRKRFYHTKVCRHEDSDAAAIETAGLHGGRASVWYFGDVGRGSSVVRGLNKGDASQWSECRNGRVHHLDVSSMYPALLRDEFYPTRLLSVRTGLSVENLIALCEHRGVIATVKARVRRPEYPYHSPVRVAYRWPDGGRPIKKRSHETTGRVVYPVGDCTLTLAGPELLKLASEDGIVSVGRANVYDVGRPFRELCDYLLGRRADARLMNDRFIEGWCKELNNSFAGKFAQRGVSWNPVDVGGIGPRWGEWKLADLDTGRVRWFRSLAGLTTEREVGQPGAKLLAGVFGYLTAYGRVLMRTIRERMPERSCLSQDTDGLWCTDDGLTSLSAIIGSGQPVPGTLRLVGSYDHVRFWTPKHYVYDGTWVLSGFSDGFKIMEGNIICSTTVTNPIRGVPSLPPSVIAETTSRVSLRSIGPSDFVGPDGWACECKVEGGSVRKVPPPLPPLPPSTLF